MFFLYHRRFLYMLWILLFSLFELNIHISVRFNIRYLTLLISCLTLCCVNWYTLLTSLNLLTILKNKSATSMQFVLNIGFQLFEVWSLKFDCKSGNFGSDLSYKLSTNFNFELWSFSRTRNFVASVFVTSTDFWFTCSRKQSHQNLLAQPFLETFDTFFHQEPFGYPVWTKIWYVMQFPSCV